MIHYVSWRKIMAMHSPRDRTLLRQNLGNAKRQYPDLPKHQFSVLRDLTATLRLSILRGELLYFSGKWYVSHSGLLRIAHRRRCVGIDTEIEHHTTEASAGRWVFRATVHKSRSTSFVGYGDADPSNVSALVHGRRCESRRLVPSTAPCARPTESASAPST